MAIVALRALRSAAVVQDTDTASGWLQREKISFEPLLRSRFMIILGTVYQKSFKDPCP